jgi:type IV pilus assembly protein PilN
MPRINLLPWRDELRQKRKKEFFLAILAAVLVGAALTFGTKLFYQGLISNQEHLNEMLETEIAKLDAQIEEIEGFEAQKNRLLERMAIIEQLQVLRPEAVHLMDEVVNIVPSGVHLTELAQQSRNVEMVGITQSNQRISTMMRNISDSDWLREPGFPRIENTGSGAMAEGRFRLGMEQVPTVDEEEAQ